MIFRLRLPHIGASPMLKHTCMIFIGDINISYVFICHKIYSMFLKKCFHNMNPQTLPVHDKGLRFPREHLRNCVQFMFITDTSRLSWGRSSHWGSNTICPKFGGHVQCFFKRGSKNITMMASLHSKTCFSNVCQTKQFSKPYRYSPSNGMTM